MLLGFGLLKCPPGSGESWFEPMRATEEDENLAYLFVLAAQDPRTCGSERAARRLGEIGVGPELSESTLHHRRDCVEGVAPCGEHLGRVLHVGDLDQRFAKGRRVIGLLTVVNRPRGRDVARGPVVLDVLAAPLDRRWVEEASSEEARLDHRDLDAEPLDLLRNRTGVSDASMYGTASGSADMQRTATLGRYRRSVSAT